MISDSPYDVGMAIMTPRSGVVAGLLAALGMLAVLFLIQPVSGLLMTEVLTQVASVFLGPPGAAGAESRHVPIGAAIHLGIGTLFGLLYAVCQQRIPTRGLIGVGLFYGFFLWVGSSFIVGALFSEEVRTMLRTWSWLLACLVYGFTLALAAIWSESRRPADAFVVPVD